MAPSTKKKAASKAPPKKAASASASKTPKTVLDKIIYAIRQQTASANGVSRAAISKYLKQELGYDNAGALKKALKKAADSGALVQTGQSFCVAGDPAPAPVNKPQIVVKDVKVPEDDALPTAQPGDTVIVQYEGKLDDGSVFDKASQFDFVLGAGDVIKGWDQGVAGMVVGQVRKLTVPPKLGYGKRGAPPEIPPNATLHFVITMKQILSDSSR